MNKYKKGADTEMTKSKKISKTLVNILDNELLKTIIDRNKKISDTSSFILDQWKYDLTNRKSNIAYDVALTDSEMKYTNLDMATFLFSLKDRKAYIDISKYDNRLPSKIKSNEINMSKDKRYGKISSITSNQKLFTFGVRIEDETVMKLTNTTSNPLRTFLITDYDGNFYEGLDTIDFDPDAKENDWLYDNDMWKDDFSNNQLKFKYFIDPNRWVSFYGQHYFLLKALEMRLSEQTKHMKKIIKEMIDSGIRFPNNPDAEKFEPYSVSKELGTKVKVNYFVAEIDLPENKTEYPKVPYNQTNLVAVDKLMKKLKKDLASARFNIRTVEWAFAQKSVTPDEEGDFHIYPHWIKDTHWEDYKIKRTMWKRLKLFQPKVGEKSVAIRYKWATKTETIKK